MTEEGYICVNARFYWHATAAGPVLKRSVLRWFIGICLFL